MSGALVPSGWLTLSGKLALLWETVIGALKEKPKLVERKGIIERVMDKLVDLILCI